MPELPMLARLTQEPLTQGRLMRGRLTQGHLTQVPRMAVLLTAARAGAWSSRTSSLARAGSAPGGPSQADRSRAPRQAPSLRQR